jgi:RNA polymerase sigma-70 factor (ECF subfamily)
LTFAGLVTLAKYGADNMSQSTRDAVVQEIARHQARLRGLVRCLLVQPSDVDDLLQEVNLVLWEKADDFEPGTDFWAWASQIVRFKVLNHARKLGRERLVFDPEILERVADVARDRLQTLDRRRMALDHCLKQLAPSQRQLIDLRYSGEHTIDRIADSIGRPTGSIRQTLYRIRTALLACIEEQLALDQS